MSSVKKISKSSKSKVNKSIKNENQSESKKAGLILEDKKNVKKLNLNNKAKQENHKQFEKTEKLPSLGTILAELNELKKIQNSASPSIGQLADLSVNSKLKEQYLANNFPEQGKKENIFLGMTIDKVLEIEKDPEQEIMQTACDDLGQDLAPNSEQDSEQNLGQSEIPPAETNDLPQNTNAHSETISQMFGQIKRYDFFNHFFSFGLDYYWRRVMVGSLTLNEEPTVLDMAAGTLDVTFSILKKFPKAKIVAGDICQEMLDFGQKKIKEHQQNNIDCQVMNVLDIPYEANTFDALTMAFGIRNVDERARALKEIFRVLKVGGQVCILEFAPVTLPVFGKIYHAYLDHVMPKIAKILGENEETYTYLASTIKNYVSPATFCQELYCAGFKYVKHQKLNLGIANLFIGIKV